MEEHRSPAKTRERWPPRVGRLDETETTEYKNKEHGEEEGSPLFTANERAVVATRCTVYTEARRSGDLDSGVICEARCVVPLSRTSCTLLRRGLRDRASRQSERSRGIKGRKKGGMGKRWLRRGEAEESSVFSSWTLQGGLSRRTQD